MGGGNPGKPPLTAGALGLSPRGRGKRGRIRGHYERIGSIPAWAGETDNDGFWSSLWSVYPRVGGGNEDDPKAKLHRLGLSPRGRGKRASSTGADVIRGSIPAWAGETTLLI